MSVRYVPTLLGNPMDPSEPKSSMCKPRVSAALPFTGSKATLSIHCIRQDVSLKSLLCSPMLFALKRICIFVLIIFDIIDGNTE